MKLDKSSRKNVVRAVTKTVRRRTTPPPAKAVSTPTAAPKTVRTRKAAPRATVKPRVARKTTVQIPPLLLEGDAPSPPPISGPGERYVLGPTAPVEHFEVTGDFGELPEAYGTKHLLLTARDPHWLYAQWDLTREQQKKYNALSGDHHLVLRIYINAAGGGPVSQIHVHPESRHWFVPVDRAGTKYVGELGYYRSGGKWVSISTSAATLTPPDAMSADTSVQFATLPVDVPFAQLLQLVKAVVREHIPLTEILQQLRASGLMHLPKENLPPAGQWTSEQERALAGIVTMDKVRCVWIGSLEITELIRRQLAAEISSAGVTQFSLPTSPGVSSVSSPFGGEQRPKSFWFNVNAELILYGATEPGATVAIGGRTIKLRPDGTFSYRFALPDGQYDLPAAATSADGSDTRRAGLRFSRSTDYRGEVGAHAQDATLRPPLAANVA
ncbi:MAG: DUF4912 domain-containing protein [Verrucomicrobia bacterium]|nr:DUF4912 domain-containing protein [Verrucomicrobiota bacterium]